MRFKEGKAIPATDNDKVKQAVLESVNAHPVHSDGFSLWIKTISVADLEKLPTDMKDCFRYTASGSAVLNRRPHSGDHLYPPKQLDFRIVFQDCKDSLGLPDIKIAESDFT